MVKVGKICMSKSCHVNITFSERAEYDSEVEMSIISTRSIIFDMTDSNPWNKVY
jgi:hypothetical protein